MNTLLRDLTDSDLEQLRAAVEGKTYECRQAHASQPGWTPAAVAALWLEV